MNQIEIFKNAEFGEIRSIVIDNEPYFVGIDVTNILGYQNGSRDINRHVDEEDKLMHQINVSGQKRSVYLINESGLYSLILKSKLPTAKKFKRWVTSEVLPAIRKTGSYSVPNQTEIDLANCSPELQVVSGLLQALAKQELQQKQLEAKVDAMQEMVAVNIRNDWRKQTHHLSNAIAGQLGSNKFGLAKNMIFAEVEARAGVDLKTRLSNMKKRMREAGATALAIDKATRVDVIAADKKLIEIYITVVKEMAINYGVYQQQLENNSGTAA